MYLCAEGRLALIRRPAFCLFRLSQIEHLFSQGQADLAELMLYVVSAPGQSRCTDARFTRKFWVLKMQTRESYQSVLDSAAYFLPPKELSLLQAAIRVEKVAAPQTPPPTTVAPASLPSSPRTPEITIPTLSGPKTPSDNEEMQKMQEEIDEVVRRTPAIQGGLPDRGDLLAKAATAIKDAKFFERSLSCVKKSFKTESRLLHSLDGTEDQGGGSAYLYAMITPSKRLQNILESDSAVSPVRRSKRLFSKDTPNRELLYTNLDQIPNFAEHGFIPNSALSAMPDSMGGRARIKTDATKDTLPPKRHKPEDPAKPDENPFE